jgi:transcriptional regulator with GAF, ATPase, and Fis domain
LAQLPPHDATRAFAELERLDLASMELEDVLSRVADLAKATIAGATQVSVTLSDFASAHTAAYTGPLAIQLDERQYELGHGPCIDAAHAGETLVIDDMTTEDRWPLYTPHAVKYGAYSSVSVGLPIQHAVTGGLNLYSDRERTFDREAVRLAQAFASHAAVALTNAHTHRMTADLATQLQQAKTNRALIEQAKGIIAGQRNCTAEDALQIMLKESVRTHRQLLDIAVDITEGPPKWRV